MTKEREHPLLADYRKKYEASSAAMIERDKAFAAWHQFRTEQSGLVGKVLQGDHQAPLLIRTVRFNNQFSTAPWWVDGVKIKKNGRAGNALASASLNCKGAKLSDYKPE